MRKRIIITGATSGIGKATMQALANERNHLIIGCRNLQKAEKAVAEITDKNDNAKIDIYLLDLASFESIKNFADNIKKDFVAVDILFNNAGVFSEKKAYTKEGFELTVGVNYIGTYYLTMLLVDVISKSDTPHIINMCSRAGLFGKFKLRENAFVRQSPGFKGYSASKYLQLISTIYLSDSLKGKVKINAVHPGDAATGIWNGDGIVMKLMGSIMKRFLSTPQEAAGAGLYLIDNAPKKSGMFYEKEGNVIEFSKYNDVFAEKLIKETNRLIAKYMDINADKQ